MSQHKVLHLAAAASCKLAMAEARHACILTCIWPATARRPCASNTVRVRVYYTMSVQLELPPVCSSP